MNRPRESPCRAWLIVIILTFFTLVHVSMAFDARGVAIVCSVAALIVALEPSQGYSPNTQAVIISLYITFMVTMYFFIQELWTRKMNYSGWDLLMGRCCC